MIPKSVLEGEHRRAAIMGAVGLVAIAALLVFRLVATTDEGRAPIGDSVLPAPVPPAAPAPPSPPSTAPRVDSALLRNPFCPVVRAPGAGAIVCPTRERPQGRQPVGLQDIFMEAGTTRARVHVGPLTFNLREGESFAGSLHVVSLGDRCGEFEQAGNRFELCEGEQTLTGAPVDDRDQPATLPHGS